MATLSLFKVSLTLPSLILFPIIRSNILPSQAEFLRHKYFFLLFLISNTNCTQISNVLDWWSSRNVTREKKR